MLNRMKKEDKGFTIIEVMIVLAIAGLIILIVFLAVPALQRNSRNTQRKDAASQVLTSITNAVSNNNGVLPSSQATLNSTYLNDYNASSYYLPAHIYYGTSTSLPTLSTTVGGNGSATSVTTEDVIFIAGTTCSNNAPTASGASARAYTVVYAIESGSSPAEQCIQS